MTHLIVEKGTITADLIGWRQIHDWMFTTLGDELYDTYHALNKFERVHYDGYKHWLKEQSQNNIIILLTKYGYDVRIVQV